VTTALWVFSSVSWAGAGWYWRAWLENTRRRRALMVLAEISRHRHVQTVEVIEILSGRR
jgi:hypothetical protein